MNMQNGRPVIFNSFDTNSSNPIKLFIHSVDKENKVNILFHNPGCLIPQRGNSTSFCDSLVSIW